MVWAVKKELVFRQSDGVIKMAAPIILLFCFRMDAITESYVKHICLYDTDTPGISDAGSLAFFRQSCIMLLLACYFI